MSFILSAAPLGKRLLNKPAANLTHCSTILSSWRVKGKKLIDKKCITQDRRCFSSTIPAIEREVLPIAFLPVLNPPKNSVSLHGETVRTEVTNRDGAKHVFEQYASQEQERALFVNDIGVPLRQVERWHRNLPGVLPFYAVKCNPDPVLLTALSDIGTNFDCASAMEMKSVLQLGVDPSQIIFANPVKNPSDLRYANQVGVRKMTFDNLDEVSKIHSLCPNAQLVLRLLPDDSGAVMRFGSKFGADADVVDQLLRACTEREMEVLGVSFHIGSGCFDARKYKAAISMCRDAFDAAKRLGIHLKLVDIGGGFPGDTALPNTDDTTQRVAPSNDAALAPPAFEDFASVVRDSFDTYFPAEKIPDLVKIGEPGRYISTGYSTLFLRVQGRREIKAKHGRARRFLYYVNDGVYGSFNCKVFDYYHPKPLTVETYFSSVEDKAGGDILGTFPGRDEETFHVPPPQVKDQKKQSCGQLSYDETAEQCLGTFFGPTCDSLDKIVEDYEIRELQVGEYVVFENMGAYTSAAATEFNGCRLAEQRHFRSLSQ